MVRLGIVYEIHNTRAVVMTPDSEFLVIKRTRDMYVGQQVKFNIQDVRKSMKPIYKYVSIASSIAAVFILVFMFSRVSLNSNVYGYVSVDINPSVEFSVDKKFEVLESKALNPDGEVIISELDAKGKNVYDVITDILYESEEHGYISQDKSNFVLVSVSLNNKSKTYLKNKSDEEIQLEGFLLNLDKKLNNDNSDYIKGRVIKVTPEERKAAEEKDISMGKYYLMEKAKESGVGISSGELKNKEISDLVAAIYANNSTSEVAKTTPDSHQAKEEDKGTTEPKPSQDNGVVAAPTATKQEKPPVKSTTKPAAKTPAPQPTADVKPTPTVAKTVQPTATVDKGNNINEDYGLKIQIISVDKQDTCNIISSRVKVINTGKTDVDLSKVKVRYYFTNENTSSKNSKKVKLESAVYNYSKGKVNDENYFMQLTTKDVEISFREVTETNMYMEMGFQSGILKKGEYAYVMWAFNKNDWSNFNQANDYSFTNRSDKFQDSRNMTAYISDRLVWGIEPY